MTRSERSSIPGWRRFLASRFDREFLQKIQALPTRQNEYGYDPFGYHRDEAIAAIYLAHHMYRYYIRPSV